MEGTTDLQKEVQPGAPTQVRGDTLLPDGRVLTDRSHEDDPLPDRELLRWAPDPLAPPVP